MALQTQTAKEFFVKIQDIVTDTKYELHGRGSVLL